MVEGEERSTDRLLLYSCHFSKSMEKAVSGKLWQLWHTVHKNNVKGNITHNTFCRNTVMTSWWYAMHICLTSMDVL